MILDLLWNNFSGSPRNAQAHSSLFRSDRFSGSGLGSNSRVLSIGCDEICALNRVAADADGGGLAETLLGWSGTQLRR